MLFFKVVAPFSHTQKKKETMSHATAWVNLEGSALSATSQSPKDKYSEEDSKEAET